MARRWPRFSIILSCLWRIGVTRKLRLSGGFATSRKDLAANRKVCGLPKQLLIQRPLKHLQPMASGSRYWRRARQKSVRKIGDAKWDDVNDHTVNTKRAYVCNLPSGKSIDLFSTTEIFHNQSLSTDCSMMENVLLKICFRRLIKTQGGTVGTRSH